MNDAVWLLALCNSANSCQSIQIAFGEAEVHVVCVTSAAEALQLLQRGFRTDLLLLDTSTGQSGKDLFLPSLMQALPSDRLCILSEAGDSSWRSDAACWNITAVLELPLVAKNMEAIIGRARGERFFPCAGARSALKAPQVHIEELSNNRFFVAACPTMMQLYNDVRVFAPVNIPVLILGESGVGKENVAMLLHKYHARSEKQLLKLNCAALPNELLESELFGYEAGAFTGATKSKPGLFELSHKGTLLLDEIGEMSPQMQAKLLHVLQDGTYCRLGGRSTSQVDVRVLAATNVDVEQSIADRRFREDLYYRLNALTITVPPLRERREEIPYLMEQLFQRGAKEFGWEVVCPGYLVDAAQEYDWPGNLRELRNFVTRTLILKDMNAALAYLSQGARSRIFVSLDTASPQPQAPKRMKDAVNVVKNDLEVRMLQDALSASGWNRRRAANNLNISYRTLLYKIQQHRLIAPV